MVVLIVVGLTIPANVAEAVSVGQICQKLGTASTAQVKKMKVPVVCQFASQKKVCKKVKVSVVCRLVSQKKVWKPIANPISTTTTTSTSIAVLPKDFVDSIESVESDSSSLHRMTFSDGVVREYILELPINYNPQVAYPLAIGLHGVSGTASSARTLMSLESGLTPLIVAYPQGLSLGVGTSPAWNAERCCEPATILQSDDVKFISRLINNIETQLRVDKSRVWAIGFSNGGMMAYRLACEISDQITGVGVGAGALTVGECAPSKKFSVIHIHGDADEDVPLNGGGPYRTQSASFSVEYVASAVGCTNDAARASANIQVWQCPDSMEMKLVIDTNQAHDWNSNWTDLMVQFLQSHPRS